VIALADTSAWIVATRDDDLHDAFLSRILNLEIGTCSPVMMELLYSTRTGAEFDTRREQLEALDCARCDEEVWRRALDVYRALAHRGGKHHRQVKHADLLVAAAAETAGWTVLHYDSHFDVISSVTGQPTEWIVPSGTF
jgi:predicted nucleic acid-binding protein